MQLMATPTYSIFKNTTDFQNEYVKNALMVDLEGASYQQLLQDAPSDLIVEIPLTNNLTIKVELAENQILSDDFMVTGKTTDGEQPFNYQPGLYYKGKIVGHPNSWAAISFFDNEIKTSDHYQKIEKYRYEAINILCLRYQNYYLNTRIKNKELDSAYKLYLKYYI